MFSLMRKKVRPNVLAGVYPGAEGTAIATVRREPDVPPTLELAAWQPAAPAGEQGEVLSRLVSKTNVDECHCVGLVNLEDYSLVLVEAPAVEPEEMRAAIRWRIKDLIDFDIDNAVVDVFDVPESKSGRANMVYGVVAPLKAVKDRADSLTQAGLNLEVIDIPELALRNIAALLPEDVGGVALVYIGQDGGLITITRQQTLYLSRRISTGINALPDTLMQANDPDVIERWLDNIIVEVQRSLDYYDSHFSLTPVTSLVLTPLPGEMPSVAQYISDQLDISTRILDIHTLVDSDLSLGSELQYQCLLAIGAALRDRSNDS